MGIGPLVGIAGHYLESLFASPASGPVTATTAPANSTSSSSAAGQTSPFAQVLDNIQELAQSNYEVITQHISGTLQSAAQSAAADGKTGLAGELTKLSGDFSSASVSWQLPNISSLVQLSGPATTMSLVPGKYQAIGR